MKTCIKLSRSQELLPDRHLVDAGYIDAQLLVNAKNDYQVDLIGPAPRDSQWQSRAGKGFGLSDFKIDWEQQLVQCPQWFSFYSLEEAT